MAAGLAKSYGAMRAGLGASDSLNNLMAAQLAETGRCTREVAQKYNLPKEMSDSLVAMHAQGCRLQTTRKC